MRRPGPRDGPLPSWRVQSRYNEDWQEKYRPQGTGLPEPQVQRLAKQIVEGLLFLHEKDFPAFYNLHLGNVILQNGVARWAHHVDATQCVCGKSGGLV